MKLKQLHEQLQGVKKYHHLTWDQMVTELKKVGIHSRSGSFGQVFMKDGWDYVIKILEKDNAYLDYVDYCIQNPNKHFPRFLRKPFSLTQFHARETSSLDKFIVVKIERLYECDPEIKALFQHNINKIISYYDMFPDKPIYVYVGTGTKGIYTFNNCQELFDKYASIDLKGVVEAIRQIRDWNNRDNNHYEDFQTSGNILQRKDGTIVISDPLASSVEVDPSHMQFNYPITPDYDNTVPGLKSGPMNSKGSRQLIMNFL